MKSDEWRPWEVVPSPCMVWLYTAKARSPISVDVRVQAQSGRMMRLTADDAVILCSPPDGLSVEGIAWCWSMQAAIQVHKACTVYVRPSAMARFLTKIPLDPDPDADYHQNL